MEELNKRLNDYLMKLSDKHTISKEEVANMRTVYPFNRFEYLISYLLADNVITLEEYFELRDEYISRNKYLYLFELAPRKFGESWGQDHISKIVPELEKPSKKKDPSFDGEYDFWFNGIKIEVKASRGVDKRLSGLPPVEKALSSNTNKSFNMNFQQLKPYCCDVFLWFAVWKDKITYWVMKNDEVVNHPSFSKGQHRGNVGEGQLWITEKNIRSFDKYLVEPSEILSKIVEKYNSNYSDNSLTKE